jgi:transcriptional regulator with XRE-family HTH domain
MSAGLALPALRRAEHKGCAGTLHEHQFSGLAGRRCAVHSDRFRHPATRAACHGERVIPGDVLRAVREQRRLSQRELAKVAGVAKSTIDRIEREHGARCSLDIMERILAATGYHLCIYTDQGYPVEVRESRFLPADRGGRLYPAHLRLRKVGLMGDPSYSPGFWWGWWHIAFSDRDPKKPTYTFDKRRSRDPSFSVNWAWSDAT